MAMKLGEALAAKGIITDPQLKKALDIQLIMGGHLGTCLIELGLLDESTLGEALAGLLSVDYAAYHLLDRIPRDVLRLLPPKLALERQAVPFRNQDKRLHVAMVKPTDLAAIDEIAFHSGMMVVPWVSPEIRIFLALEKHYGVPRRRRFIALSCELERLDRERSGNQEPAMVDPTEPPAGAHEGREEVQEEPTPVLISPDSALEVEYHRPWQEVAAELFADEESAIPPAAPSPPAERSRPISLQEFTDEISVAESLEDVASSVLAFVRSSTPRCVLFLVRSTEAKIWDACGVEPTPEARESLRLQITWEPVFRLFSELSYYMGPLPEESDYESFYRHFRMERPEQVLLWPVYLEDRLVAILYGDAGPGQPLNIDPRVFSRMIQKLTLALNMLVIKRKIHVA